MVGQQRLLEVFVELADTLVADFDAVDLMYTLAQASVELLDADAAGLMLSDQRGNLQPVAASSEESRVLELFELQHQEGPCVDCFALGRAVTNVGPAEATLRWPQFGPAVRAAGFTTVHALPLRLRGDVIGAMNLFVQREGDLTNEDLSLAQGLADMATIGLLQERAIQESQLLAEQLQGALNSRIVIEQAKGVLSERHTVDMADAFTMLRSHARGHGRPLMAVAVEVIDGTSTLDR
jgi:GAF domain-containing protein